MYMEYDLADKHPVSTRENPAMKTVPDSGRMSVKLVVGSCLVVVVLFVIPIALLFHQQAEWNQASDEVNQKYMDLSNAILAANDQIQELQNKSEELSNSLMETKEQVEQLRNTTSTADVTIAPELTTASVIPIGWETSGNLYYKCFTNVTVDYATATANCGSYGGRLAAKVLRDPVAVKNIISQGCIGAGWTTGEAPWVGFDDLSSEGEWKWVDEGNMDPATTVWLHAEPNNQGGNEHCGHIYSIVGGKITINDNVCSTLLRYICEIVIVA